MRNFTFLLLFILLGGFFGTASAQYIGGAGIVSSYGRLQVSGSHVCDQSGNQITLGGMSMFWSGWASKYYTAATVDYLVDNFKISVLRATYGCPAGSGPQGDIADIQAVVNQCIARGIYVIIDWHIEGDNTPYVNQEISFFQSMVQQYGNNNNVLYELWNEPTTSAAATIQGACQQVANAIRATENQYGYAHHLVICGSDTWSQNPQSYKITDPNAAYTFHGYFDNQPSHLTTMYNNAQAAMNNGSAVFVTEYGASYCNHANTDQAIAWCQTNNICMCAWSVNDKVEDWSIFTNNLDALTCVGQYYQSKIKVWPTKPFQKIYPTAVAITPTSVTIPFVGSTSQLTTVFTPSNATETTVAWSSNNPGVATVSASGVVTGVATGTAVITVTAKNSSGANITGTSTVTVQNLTNVALNKAVTVSSVESGASVSVVGTNAVDGNTTTRWSSAAADPQTIQIDLGASYNVSLVTLNWETASAKDYTVQISVDGTTWTTIATKTGMPAGPRTDNVSVSGTGRYIKMVGTARNTVYGYSIYEFGVYGTPAVVVHPTSVSVTPATASAAVGGTTQLTATVLPSNATNASVTWSSSNTAVATVSASGLVTGVAAGTAVITATTVDGALTSSSNVTVSTVAVTGVSLSPSTLSLSIAATGQLTPAIVPSNASNKSVTYTSSNTAIATVSATGLVIGVAAGSATITVKSVDGNFTATCAVSVTSIPPFDLKIEAETYNAKSTAPQSEACSDAGGGLDMGYISTGDWMTWAVTIPTTATYTVSFRVASPNSNAQLRLDANAGATVFGTANIPNTGGWQNWQTVTVSMTLNAGTYNLGMNALTGGFNINWLEIVGGSVTPVSVTGITVTASASVAIGATSQLTATITPTNATNKNVNWSSSNAAIATVSASGLVTGVAAGTANITATSVDGGFSAVSVITVTAATCPTWQANTNYPSGTVVTYNGQNYTSNNDWNGTAGDPYTATHSTTGWGWVIGGSCTKSTQISSAEAVKVSTLTLYPNPVNDGVFNIAVTGFESNEIVSVQIFNIGGQAVYSTLLSIAEDGTQNVQITANEGLKVGAYIVKIQGSQAVKQAHLIINQ